MKKLTLHLDDLRIESFETTKTEKKEGTVHAAATRYSECTCDISCGTESCDHSCGGWPSCDPTCDGFVTYINPHQPCIAC